MCTYTLGYITYIIGIEDKQKQFNKRITNLKENRKTMSFILDEESIKLINRVCKDITMDTNWSAAVRYCIKYASKHLLKDE
jgi:hypothetical protein